jgi:hypothetical protein
MLTVKHIDSGIERITEASRVEFFNTEDDRSLQVYISTGIINYTSGVVYVMNDKGSTVGKYELG